MELLLLLLLNKDNDINIIFFIDKIYYLDSSSGGNNADVSDVTAVGDGCFACESAKYRYAIIPIAIMTARGIVH